MQGALVDPTHCPGWFLCSPLFFLILGLSGPPPNKPDHIVVEIPLRTEILIVPSLGSRGPATPPPPDVGGDPAFQNRC